MPPAAILPEKRANVTHTGASGAWQSCNDGRDALEPKVGPRRGLASRRRFRGVRFGHGGRLLDGAGMLVAQDLTGGIARCCHLNQLARTTDGWRGPVAEVGL